MPTQIISIIMEDVHFEPVKAEINQKQGVAKILENLQGSFFNEDGNPILHKLIEKGLVDEDKCSFFSINEYEDENTGKFEIESYLFNKALENKKIRFKENSAEHLLEIE